MLRSALIALLLSFSVSCAFGGLADLRNEDLELLLSGGQSQMNRHGHDVFRSAELALTGDWPRLDRFLPGARAGAAITYNAVRQARSWFGYQFGEPDDRVTAVSSYFFVRQAWRAESAALRPYAELGSGPMWSNRRVPAATSRLNFESRIGLGVVIRRGREPIYVGYRFAHISNAGIVSRNPGVNLHAIVFGRRLSSLRR